eukprot:snap_masked-scaffold_3-processed-gene-21.54-mRNA-1 protein AED:1.00 eAED:1.00 QI:0/-1/0/0/-1/1/1/0/309
MEEDKKYVLNLGIRFFPPRVNFIVKKAYEELDIDKLKFMFTTFFTRIRVSSKFLIPPRPKWTKEVEQIQQSFKETGKLNLKKVAPNSVNILDYALYFIENFIKTDLLISINLFLDIDVCPADAFTKLTSFIAHTKEKLLWGFCSFQRTFKEVFSGHAIQRWKFLSIIPSLNSPLEIALSFTHKKNPLTWGIVNNYIAPLQNSIFNKLELILLIHFNNEPSEASLMLNLANSVFTEKISRIWISGFIFDEGIYYSLRKLILSQTSSLTHLTFSNLKLVSKHRVASFLTDVRSIRKGRTKPLFVDLMIRYM